jgi:hypothetical protein
VDSVVITHAKKYDRGDDRHQDFAIEVAVLTNPGL